MMKLVMTGAQRRLVATKTKKDDGARRHNPVKTPNRYQNFDVKRSVVKRPTVPLFDIGGAI
ncbi:MAG: hypothetical protein WB762_21480 [Candidatus Sulfotelmatobacter sp.]